jgi:hypothetical protein
MKSSVRIFIYRSPDKNQVSTEFGRNRYCYMPGHRLSFAVHIGRRLNFNFNQLQSINQCKEFHHLYSIITSYGTNIFVLRIR